MPVPSSSSQRPLYEMKTDVCQLRTDHKKYYVDLTLVRETGELASRDEESNKFGGIRNSHICWEWI